MLTADKVREALDYDAETGVFRWMNPSRRADLRGKVAGSPNSFGYIAIVVGEKKYQAHRLAWLYVRGEWPAKFIDHINGDKADNRIANLREATKAQNSRNRPKTKSNTTGFKGVTFDRRKNKFKAGVMIDGKQLHLGLYPTAEEANAAYLRAAQHHFGEFARAG